MCAGASHARQLTGDVFKINTKSLCYHRSIIKLNLYAQLGVPQERGDGVWVVCMVILLQAHLIYFFHIFLLPTCKASSQPPFTFSYPKINQNWFVLTPGAPSQVACTGGSRTVSDIPQLRSTACPKNTLSPPERLCKHHVFEMGATVGAHHWHVGWRSHSHQLQRAGVLFIFMHIDAIQMAGTDLWRGLMQESI